MPSQAADALFILSDSDIALYLVAVPVAIVMAWRGVGYWALVALPLTLNLIQMTLSWLMVQLEARPASSRHECGFHGRLRLAMLQLPISYLI